jgi:hypothetical protein
MTKPISWELDTASDRSTRSGAKLDGQVIWDTEEADYFWILNDAQRRYAERSLALAEK